MRKHLCQCERDTEFVYVGLSCGLEPNCASSGFHLHEAELWTCVELSEDAGQSQTERTNLLLRPSKQFLEPTGPCKRPGRLRGRMPMELRERVPDQLSFACLDPVTDCVGLYPRTCRAAVAA